MAGQSTFCPGCRQKIQIPSAAECRRALAEQTSISGGSLISQATAVLSVTPSANVDSTHLPRPDVLGMHPAPAAEQSAEVAPGPEEGPALDSQPVGAVRKLRLPLRRSDRLGLGGLFLCGAALVCVWVPVLCVFVIPLALVSTLIGLAGLALVLLDDRRRLSFPIAGAAVPIVVLFAALFFPTLLGPTFLASRAKTSADRADIHVIPLRGDDSSVSADPNWVDASKASLQLGQLNIQVMSVSIRSEEPAESPSGKKATPVEHCFVRVRTQAVVAASEFSAKRSQSQSSNSEAPRIQLTGSGDKTYELQGVQEVEPIDKKRKGTAFPVSIQDHVFMFEAPAARPNYLFLEIPADTWGGKGAFRFTIPGSMINDLRGKPGRLQPKDPKAPKKGAELFLGR
jgi:hypothetical protein